MTMKIEQVDNPHTVMTAITGAIMPLLVVGTHQTSRSAMMKPKTSLRVVGSIMITPNVLACHWTGK